MPEIEIRPAIAEDIPTLSAIDHTYSSDYVWQMEIQVEESLVSVNFREIRLPRSVRVEYPRPVHALAEDWAQRDKKARKKRVRNARGVLFAPSSAQKLRLRFIVAKVLMRGNHVVAEAAVRAGCRYYFGYPITPQNEIPEYMSERLASVEGGVFIQAESEIASINLLLGASATGTRAMSFSSSPGISLMQEGLSYMAGSVLPVVIVNISRSGPGLGGMSASQGDYFQATRGGGHGDYRMIVLAPSTIQEMYDLTFLAFDLSDKYRNPAMILGDALIGQMKEPLVRTLSCRSKTGEWLTTGIMPRQEIWIIGGSAISGR